MCRNLNSFSNCYPATDGFLSIEKETAIKRGCATVLIAFPEAIITRHWKFVLDNAYRQNLCMVVYDEVHCISEWHDGRMNTPPVSSNIVTLTGSATAAGTSFMPMDHQQHAAQQHAAQQHTVMSKLPVDNSNIGPGMTVGNSMMTIGQPQIGIRPTLPTSVPQVTAATAQPTGSSNSGDGPKVLDKKRLQELVKEVDPLEQLDDDVEEVLLQIADDFIESVVTASCQIAKHRKSSTLEARDVQLHLERAHNMWIPGFGTDDLRPYKKACTTEAHKQRMALIRKTMKKT